LAKGEVFHVDVLIAVSSVLMLPGIRDRLHSLDGSVRLRESTDHATTRQLVEERRPDVLLLELGHIQPDGCRVLRDLCSRAPATHVVVLTFDKSHESVQEAIAAGASGYLFLGDDLSDLADVVCAVHAGDVRVSSSVLQFLLSTTAAASPVPPPRVTLTEREREVLHLVATGCPSKDIAAQLCISPRTVDTHRANIRKKLGVHSVADLVRYEISSLPPP
jgi:DNA-binding NarL/FixJ family response regulator